MTTQQYITSITQRYNSGNATEHTYRGDLQLLIETLVPDIRATNEPKRQQCGAPDYIITKKEIPVGFIEAKDIGDADLDGTKKTGNKEQFDRYKGSLNNLIFTDYLNFHLYHDGVFVTKVAIAQITNKGIVALPENMATFENLLKNFCSHISQTIKSAKKLAEMMAGKARLLSDVIENALNSDEATQQNSTLKDQMLAFKQILIHDITPKAFADVYAQTIAYGMFAARLHDPTLPTFSRSEAAELIPKSNPFLRKLFGYIAGPDIDDRIKWIVDSLVDIFLACNVEEILKNYGKTTRTEDPIIHFYETFLSEYDPKLRKARGVWYTPAPVVNFIVRAVDDILKTEFNLPNGLADTNKTNIKINQQGKTIEQEVHKVQILDPATGTGTFLAEVVKQIHKNFEGQQGIWSNYVEAHLLPRLNGFELLMASYAMAHLQLDLLLKETGYTPLSPGEGLGVRSPERLRVYLTNSLEESHPDTGTLFANWLSTEANEANHIKRDTPVMCVIGNPPYAVSSTNKSDWIQNLIADYKKDLNERKINLDDDYIKFIRYGQHFIDRNGSGVLAYISANSFVDGVTHRQMRKHLLESFDKIYILDLHGNSKKKEVCLDGTPDQNVFDIMQGVSINLFIKTGKKKKGELGEVFHFDLFGKRELKNEFLIANEINSIDWEKIKLQEPYNFFINLDYSVLKKYEKGFPVSTLFENYNSGIQTKRDALTINYTKHKLESVILDFKNLNVEEIRKKYSLPIDGRDWKIQLAKNDLEKGYTIIPIQYRLFDTRYTAYTGRSKGFIAYPRETVSSHFIKENIGLIFKRTGRIYGNNYDFFFVSKNVISEGLFAIDPLGREFIAPLYLYSSTSTQQTLETPPEKIPNFNKAIINKIEKSINHIMIPEGMLVDLAAGCDGTFTPVDVLDYIYAVLHSPTYREKYKEFLKIDFPRVPYPTGLSTFERLTTLGSQLRQIHLLEAAIVNKPITKYPVDGDNLVVKIHFNCQAELVEAGLVTGNVYINDTQYFAGVPQIAWEFYIGGYQPAQKWLKDRKGRKLQFEDILHYQKIIVALTETDRLMKEIDKVGVE